MQHSNHRNAPSARHASRNQGIKELTWGTGIALQNLWRLIISPGLIYCRLLLVIERFNFKQVLLGFGSAFLGIAGYVAGYFFFAAILRFLARSLEYDEIGDHYGSLFSAFCLCIVTLSGAVRARNGKMHIGFDESDLHIPIEPVTGGAFTTGRAVSRITVPAFFIVEALLIGPLQLWAAVRRFRMRIPKTPGLELRLETLQKEIEARPKHHPLADYGDRAREVLLLARMGRIVFSRQKGTVSKCR
jgi:hypothetical protein